MRPRLRRPGNEAMTNPNWGTGDRVRRGAAMALLVGGLGILAANATRLPTAVQHTERPAFRARTVPILERDTSAVAIQVELPYTALCFPRADGGWEAQFDLIATAWRHGRQVAGDLWHESIRVTQRRELHARKSRFVGEYVLPLPPGEYEIEVTLSEPQCGEEGRIRVGAYIPAELKGQASLSAILLGACGLSGSVRELLADPRVRLDFADPAESVCAYAELSHRGLAGDSIRVRWRLTPADEDATLREGAAAFGADTASTRLAWPVPLEGLGFDTYRLVATATLGDARVEGSVVFGVEIESETSLAPFFRDALDILEYIAGESEVAALRMANPADRAARWAEFWKKRDPTPETDANEFKEEFFRRMRYADTEFAATGRGWRTDRGRIYIQHGEPDSIERDAMPRDGYPIEIWLYDRLGLRFVFLDRTGFGDYRQVEGPG